MKSVIALLVILSFNAHAETTLVDRTFGIRILGASVVCTPPVAPNGHNFPVYTNLQIQIENFSLYFANVWSNVSDYRLDPPNYNSCETYRSLMSLGYHVGSIHQTVSEKYSFSNGTQRGCLRETREEDVLTIEGQTFRGSQSFLAGPVDPSYCQ